MKLLDLRTTRPDTFNWTVLGCGVSPHLSNEKKHRVVLVYFSEMKSYPVIFWGYFIEPTRMRLNVSCHFVVFFFVAHQHPKGCQDLEGDPGVTSREAEGVSLRDQLEAACAGEEFPWTPNAWAKRCLLRWMVDGPKGEWRGRQETYTKNSLKQQHLPFDSAVFFGGEKGMDSFVWVFRQLWGWWHSERVV